MKRLALVTLAVFVLLPGCSLAGSKNPRFSAEFTRAVQIFPGVKVRVLGVEVGHVVSATNVPGGVKVTFQLVGGTKVPADVQAAVVPMSLLGERYIQLFPAYRSGPALQPGATIPLSRTAVPAEPDELLRSLQDYLGQLDPATVTSFVENASQVLQGQGTDINRLIQHGASVLSTLSAKRDDLAQLIVELNKLTLALSTRQAAIGRLIRNYDAVAGTLNANRQALEGTITGLNSAAVQLASLLVAHRAPLESDIKTLTTTGRTLSRNVGAFAQTGSWATRLFRAASRATDYNRNWLRLGNQGQELAALILLRLEERLIEFCQGLGLPTCSTPSYWATHVPNLFCFDVVCPKPGTKPPATLTKAVANVPTLFRTLQLQAKRSGDKTVQDLIQQLLDQTIGNPTGLGGLGGLFGGTGLGGLFGGSGP